VEATPSPNRTRAILAGLLLVLAGGIFLQTRLWALRQPLIGIDEALYLVVAQNLEQGRVLYADVWDHKPPTIYVFYQALLHLEASARPIHACGLLFSLLSGGLIFWLGRRWFGTWSGVAAAWLWVVFTAEPWAVAHNTEVPLNLAQLAALALLPAAGASRRRGLRLSAAGAVMGLAFMTKYVIGAPFLAIAAWWTVRRFREAGRRAAAADALALGGGFLAGLLPALGYITWHGIWPEFLATGLAFNAGYVFVDTVRYFVNYGGAFILGYLRQQWPLWVLGGAGFVLLWCRRPAARPGEGPPRGLLTLWLAGCALAVVAPLKFLDHYFLLLIPGLCLLGAAPLADGAWPRRAKAAWAVALAALTLPLTVRDVPRFQAEWERLAPPAVERFYEPLLVGRYLRRHTAPSDRIFVWRSFDTDIYFHAERRPAGRFFFWPYLLRPPTPPGGQGAFRREFERHPPRYVVTGTDDNYRQYRFPWLEETMARDYEAETVIGAHRISRRKETTFRP